MYIAQLEKTMLDYHSSKMIEINKIITDTWKEIYDGIDIRNIEINTSEDEKMKAKKAVWIQFPHKAHNKLYN